jgi:probable addiction module antidote protein
LTRRRGGSCRYRYGPGEIGHARRITREGLYKALSEDGNPSFGTILKVVKALGLQLHATKAGA